MNQTEQAIPLSEEMRRDEFASSSEQRQKWANRVAEVEKDAAIYKQAVILIEEESWEDVNGALLRASLAVEKGLCYDDIPDITIVDDRLT